MELDWNVSNNVSRQFHLQVIKNTNELVAISGREFSTPAAMYGGKMKDSVNG
jgi:hypothetical protein